MLLWVPSSTRTEVNHPVWGDDAATISASQRRRSQTFYGLPGVSVFGPELLWSQSACCGSLVAAKWAA